MDERVRAALTAYWKRAQHCCDPEETAAELIAALDEAGFVIREAGGYTLTVDYPDWDTLTLDGWIAQGSELSLRISSEEGIPVTVQKG